MDYGLNDGDGKEAAAAAQGRMEYPLDVGQAKCKHNFGCTEPITVFRH